MESKMIEIRGETGREFYKRFTERFPCSKENLFLKQEENLEKRDFEIQANPLIVVAAKRILKDMELRLPTPAEVSCLRYDSSFTKDYPIGLIMRPLTSQHSLGNANETWFDLYDSVQSITGYSSPPLPVFMGLDFLEIDACGSDRNLFRGLNVRIDHSSNPTIRYAPAFNFENIQHIKARRRINLDMISITSDLGFDFPKHSSYCGERHPLSWLYWAATKNGGYWKSDGNFSLERESYLDRTQLMAVPQEKKDV